MRAPWFTCFDIGVTKRFTISGNTNVELRADVLNVFDNTNFDSTVPVFSSTGAGAAATIFQATAAYRDPNNTFDPGGRLRQLVFRLNW